MTDPTPTRDEAVPTEYWWLIEMPDTDGSSLYLTMLPGINQTAFRPDPWKATRFKRQADAEAHASTFYKPGFGVRAVEHAFDRSEAQ